MTCAVDQAREREFHPSNHSVRALEFERKRRVAGTLDRQIAIEVGVVADAATCCSIGAFSRPPLEEPRLARNAVKSSP